MVAHRLAAALIVAAVAVVGLVGVAPAVSAQEAGNNTTTANNTTTEEAKTSSDEPALELQQSDFAVVHDITWRDGYALVTIRTEQPVTVTYPTQGTGKMDENTAREVITETKRIPRGETTIRVELSDGNAFFTVDDATIVLSGQQQVDVNALDTIGPTKALVLGAVAGTLVAGYIAYKRTNEDLEQPIKAREVWRKRK